MAIQPTPAASSPNQHAWRHAVFSGLVLWTVVLLVSVTALATAVPALSFVGPMALGCGICGLVASNVRFRIPPVVYPVAILAVAFTVNAPVLELLF
jgi:hypothetical protein